MTDKLRLHLFCCTNKVGSEYKAVVSLADYGFTDEEWAALTPRAQDKLLYEWAIEFFNNHGEMGAYVE